MTEELGEFFEEFLVKVLVGRGLSNCMCGVRKSTPKTLVGILKGNCRRWPWRRRFVDAIAGCSCCARKLSEETSEGLSERLSYSRIDLVLNKSAAQLSKVNAHRLYRHQNLRTRQRARRSLLFITVTKLLQSLCRVTKVALSLFNLYVTSTSITR